MKRKNIAAYTEDGADFPAFISINQEPDGTYSIVVRERGNNGNTIAQIDRLSFNQIQMLVTEMLDGMTVRVV